ncbi:helicase-1 [Betabaculovirus altermyunipunctae]|uniref:Helicase-1 n=1 Tax=Betabaculovirus altermyunipunctae TaxID=3051996 RepID=A0A1S5YDZ8_9BBAC|nr:helicase-1 [Betabaculovirus altermyunipunctae]AQQ80359.1 helicase-1 [Betabaculovirus altermyunipunctae]
MATSLCTILNTYQTHERLSPKDCASNEYWLFRNDTTGVYKKRCRPDVDFYMQLFNDVQFAEHAWCLVGNFYNTKIKPYVLRADYERCIFDFQHLTDDANHVQYAGDYVYWPNLSARFFGWTLFLKLNFDIRLEPCIPLPNHRRLGKQVNLLSNRKTNLDVGATLSIDDRLLFCNGPYLGDDCNHAVLEVDWRNDNTTTTTTTSMMFSTRCVGVKNQVSLDYLVTNENITACRFTRDYSYLGDIDLNRLRVSNYEDVDDEPMDVDESAVALNHRSDIKISPSSLFQHEFENKIDECLTAINEYMVEGMPSYTGCDLFLFEYMRLNEYTTLPYLIINTWQYCLETVQLHNQYTLEDILMFLYVLCTKLAGGQEEVRDKLYHTNQIYLNSKDNAQKFFASLNFFTEPQRALGYYFAIHFAVFKKYATWNMTSTNVMACELEANVVSFGFFKKIKHNEVSYVFNGKIYEFVKNKKDHDIASHFDKADETQVSVFKFNSIMNFYLTEDGMFDVCTKTYRETCPFLVVSALKKNYISKSKQFVRKQVFADLFNAMRNDVVLLRTYHAKKFEMQFVSVYANLKDCSSVGERFAQKRLALLDKIKTMVRWLMTTDENMLVLLMMRLQLNDHLHNIIKEGDDLDIMALQLAIACQFLWPKAAVTSYVWCLLKSHQFFEIGFEEYVMQTNDIFNGLNDPLYYKERKTLIERLHFMIKTNITTLVDECDIDSFMREHIEATALGVALEQKPYERWRVIKKINTVYSKYRRIPIRYSVWTDKLIEFNEHDDMYTWLTRFYKRIYLSSHMHTMSGEEKNMLTNFVQGFCYFRVLTNFNTTNSKAIINFCASLAIPTDYEKMCLNITSEPNCGKSSLFELLDKIILVYKSDRKVYDHTAENNSSKIKRFESQLYIMNEAEITTKGYLKNIADSTKFDSANRKYGPEESFYANYKVMITNNEMLYIKDGYDKACSNRIGLIYIDHSFESDIEPFDGSVYECYERKRYHEIKDINMKLKSPVKQFLANVLYYNSDPRTGYVYYKSILKNDKCYRHNKKCLYIYNDRLEALLYVLDIKEVKPSTEDVTPARFTESTLIEMVTKCVELVKQMVHYKKRESIDVNCLVSDFRRKYGRSKFFNPETNTYENLTIITSEKHFRNIKPRLKSSVDEYMI